MSLYLCLFISGAEADGVDAVGFRAGNEQAQVKAHRSSPRRTICG